MIDHRRQSGDAIFYPRKSKAAIKLPDLKHINGAKPLPKALKFAYAAQRRLDAKRNAPNILIDTDHERKEVIISFKEAESKLPKDFVEFEVPKDFSSKKHFVFMCSAIVYAGTMLSVLGIAIGEICS